MNKFQLLYDAQIKKARSRQPQQSAIAKNQNFSKLARMSINLNELGLKSQKISVASSQLSTAQISERNGHKKIRNIESSVLIDEKQKLKPISIDKLNLDHDLKQPQKIMPSARHYKFSQKLFFASDLIDTKKFVPYRSINTQMSSRTSKTPKAGAKIALFNTQRTSLKYQNFMSPPCQKETHERSLIQSKISKIFNKNKSVDLIPKAKYLKSQGSGSTFSCASKVSKVSKVKLTTIPVTFTLGKKLQMNRSQLMVPKKPSAISRQNLLNTARPEQFNQTFGVETHKINLGSKVVKIKKAPVQNNGYKEIPHEDTNQLNIDLKTLQRQKLGQTATELIKLNQNQNNLKATPKIMKVAAKQKKYSKQNKENCLYRLYSERFSIEGPPKQKRKSSILSPTQPFAQAIIRQSTQSTIPFTQQRQSQPTVFQQANSRSSNFFLRNGVTLGQPHPKNNAEKVCCSPQQVTTTSNSNSWSQLPSMSTDTKQNKKIPWEMKIKTMMKDNRWDNKLRKKLNSPHESLTGIQEVVEFEKTQKSAITHELTPDELAAHPYDLDGNFTPNQKAELIKIMSFEKQKTQISRASIIKIDLGLNSDKDVSFSPSESQIKNHLIDFIDRSRSQIFSETMQRINIQGSPGQHTTTEKSEKDEGQQLEHGMFDISEAKQQELDGIINLEQINLEQINQDSSIDGTFRLDNTLSLEKFKELEKLCEGDASRNQNLSNINSDISNRIISVDNIDGPSVKFQPEVQLRRPSLQNEHFQQTLNTMSNLDLLAPYLNCYLRMPHVNLPKPSQQLNDNWPGTNPKVIFIDIDETMVHCIDQRDHQNMKAQFQLTVRLDKSLKIDINIRPGLIECLKILKQCYQLVSFTASDQLYADTILDFIDPYHDLFSARLYRQHCVETEYGLIKDLRIIKNRELKDLLIVDNSTLSFAFNVLNGVPILPYYDNQNDEELRHLTYYLMGLKDAAVDDIRIHNDQAFGLLRLVPNHNDETQNNEMKNEESGYQDEQSSFVDQPINFLSLMNTNNIIEERSNEDGGQSSQHVSPEQMNRHQKRIYLTQESSKKDSQEGTISGCSDPQSNSHCMKQSQQS